MAEGFARSGAALDREGFVAAQWRWPVGMPLCRPFGDGLWEIRTRTGIGVSRAFGRTARVHQENARDAGRRFSTGTKAPKGAGVMSKKHMGSSIDDFLKEEGIFEETQAQAVKEVIAWQLAEAMKERKISKNKMAALLKTSRTQVDRLLDPKNDITLSSLQRAAAIVGRRVSIELV
jgi:antitoxin HicB